MPTAVRFTGKTLLSQSLITGIALSPDGAALVYSRIHRNEAPLLLLQADGDLRCPPVHSEIPYSILKMRGRTVEMVRYPDESHVMLMTGRPDRRVDRIERIVDWFQRYL